MVSMPVYYVLAFRQIVIPGIYHNLFPHRPQVTLSHRGKLWWGSWATQFLSFARDEWPPVWIVDLQLWQKEKNESDIDKRLRGISYWEMEGRWGPKNSSLSPGEGWLWLPQWCHPPEGGLRPQVPGRAACGRSSRPEWSCMADYSLYIGYNVGYVWSWIDCCRFRVKDIDKSRPIYYLL